MQSLCRFFTTYGAPTVGIFKSPERKLVVLDDLMNSNRGIITKIFKEYSHHYNFSSSLYRSSLFDKQIREISLNSKFVVLFKNCRDLRRIECFLRQAFPTNTRAVMDAYMNETRAPNSYRFLDFRCDTPDRESVLKFSLGKLITFTN